MRGVAAQTRVLGQFSAKPSQSLQDFIGARVAPDKNCPIVLYQVDLIAFPEAQFPHKIRGQPDGKGVSPFGNLHLVLSAMDKRQRMYSQNHQKASFGAFKAFLPALFGE